MNSNLHKRYGKWLTFKGSNAVGVRISGYGAAPHGQRLEGYPTDQAHASETAPVTPCTGPNPVKGATPRDGSPRANDAATRPKKPVFIYSLMQNLH